MEKNLNIRKFKEANEILKDIILKTPIIKSEYFSNNFGVNLWLKPENLQITGAFKIRGAYYKMSKLTENKKVKGVITASAGNHAQGVALSANLMGINSTIVMPETTPLVKINNTKKYGAKVILRGSTFDDSVKEAKILAQKEEYEFIHPFDDFDIATGQGTIAFDILEELPQTDIIVVPVGGGGLIAGIAYLAKLLKPQIKIIGVEPRGAACLLTSVNNNNIVTLEKINTIADGVAVKTPGKQIFPILENLVDEIIVVDDQEILGVFLDMLENHKLLVENAGLLSVAALKHISVSKDTNIVSVLSGGNMDVITLSSLLQHGLISRGRVFTFSVLLPDRPGELENIARIVASLRGNIIRLDHNQFVSINRNNAVELTVTLEAFGIEHKDEIVEKLKKENYNVKLVKPSSIYD